MSESEAAAGRVDDEDDDCPLCLEPLPPFWDTSGRILLMCCFKEVCADCRNKQATYLDRVGESGTWGKAEEQLGGCCPCCRAELPEDDINAKAMEQKFNNGQLPLSLYPNLGMHYLKGEEGVEQNVAKGFEILMLGAEKGDPKCQYHIGAYYHFGEFGVHAPEEAKRWFLAATEQGHAIAEFCLAGLARDEGNDAECLRYLGSSASKGYNKACYQLGIAYYEGEYGLQPSVEEAIRVLTPVAERGHASSMGLLGFVMAKADVSLPPPKNPNFTKGVQLLRRAAEKGDQQSITSLGKLQEATSSICFICYKKAPPEKAFLRCSRCHAAWYCSKDCQVQHWRADEGGHKQYCIKWCPQK